MVVLGFRVSHKFTIKCLPEVRFWGSINFIAQTGLVAFSHWTKSLKFSLAGVFPQVLLCQVGFPEL